MIGYTTVGTDDLETSSAFYDPLLALLGATRCMQAQDFIAWGTDPQSPMFSIHLPADGAPASVGNGVMIALAAADVACVQAMHDKALQLGARDEGAPGTRGDSGFYAGYFRDLDGNKLNVHCMSGK
ncbi:MAG: VOC family protein [Pseudomonadales bacterium]|nr:VOC family protein [Pseudomonadales bacterium]NRA18318.1 VOC family protein [Oceanospirillaceae bacterium]